MSSTRSVILKNAGVLMISQGVTWVLTLLLTIFLPRYIGANGTGALGIAYSIWTIVGVAAKFGMDTMLVKAIARDPQQTSRLLGTSLVLRSLLMAVGFVAVFYYLQIVDYPPSTVAVIWIGGLTQFLWQLVSAYQSVLQALETMQHISIATILGKVVNTVLGIGVLLLGFGVYAIAGVGALSALVTVGFMAYFLSSRYRPKLAFDLPFALGMMKDSWPYLFSGFALVLYTEVDVLIISWLVDQQTVGWYGAADRLFGTMLFLRQ